jgi:hypothetical protein
MKAFITMFDKNGHMDGTLLPLFAAFEKTSLADADIIIIPITFMSHYQADTDLMSEAVMSGKKMVVVDFVEYGWDVAKPDHIFTVNTYSKWLDKFKDTDYLMLDTFLKSSIDKIALYFKRELPSDANLNISFKILPAEYPGVSTLPGSIYPATYEEFTDRPIDVIMVWGLSNPSRPILHGELVKQSGLNGQHLVSNLDHFTTCQKRGDKRMIVMAHIPDFARVSIQQILHLQSLAKISISLNGCGKRCFRHAESPYNTVMALQENGYPWSYSWIDGFNCIELPNRSDGTLIDENRSYMRLMHYLDRPQQLYDMYLHGTNNWKNYDVNNYSEDYILKNIQDAI